MIPSTDLLVIVPAPLHAPSLPRTVLRPLAGRPLLLHTLDTAAGVVADRQHVLVVTDDDEVALLAERNGAAVVHDTMPLDESRDRTLHDLVVAQEQRRATPFRVVLLLRPAAPLILPADVHAAIGELERGQYDAVVSAAEESHHAWMRVGDRYVPDFVQHQRVYAAAPMVRETGAFIVARRESVVRDRFVGPRVGFVQLPASRAVDIRSAHEWWICERLKQRRRIVFVVAGNAPLGMGHIYRAQQIANEITNHEVAFVCVEGSELAAQTIGASGYETVLQRDEPLAEMVLGLAPDCVINDFLDTDADYVRRLQASGAKVVNFEDLGGGAEVADLVVNELFMEPVPLPNHRIGHEYFCIRDEFLSAEPPPFHERVESILLTFGGTDAEDLTSRTLEIVWPEIASRDVRLMIVTGSGYLHHARLRARVRDLNTPRIELANGTKRISAFMSRADLAFSTSGRTLFELAMMRVPALVIACNAREEAHPFASSHSGFRYLGRHDRVDDDTIRNAFVDLLTRADCRLAMRRALERFDFRSGKRRVLAEIGATLGAPLN